MELINITTAILRFHLPRYRFHHWVARGHLRRIAKVPGKGQAGDILLDADAVARLVANPPKEGRPPGGKTGQNSSKSGAPKP